MNLNDVFFGFFMAVVISGGFKDLFNIWGLFVFWKVWDRVGCGLFWERILGFFFLVFLGVFLVIIMSCEDEIKFFFFRVGFFSLVLFVYIGFGFVLRKINLLFIIGVYGWKIFNIKGENFLR